MQRVSVVPKAAQRLKRGHPWVYRTELVKAPRGLEPGAVVEIIDSQAQVVGQAFWATTSPIALRLATRAAATVQRLDEVWLEERLRAALAMRAPLKERDAFRAVHGEADGLPGVFVDKYADTLTLQTLAEWADVWRPRLARLLVKVLGARLVVSRDDGSGRDFEGLPRSRGVLLGEGPTSVTYHEGQSVLTVDLLADAKTGGFLDQLDNHVRAGELCPVGAEVLDTFSYHGGFALALAGKAKHVKAVELDEAASQRIRANAEANGRSNVEVLNGNAFDVLRAEAERGPTYDVVVVDPPGLAKREQGMEAARRAYHELNVRAFKLLKPGGLLVSCSCSGKVSRDAFDEMLRDAAGDARRQVQVLERRGAGLDHPGLMALPETEYLKAWFVRALS